MMLESWILLKGGKTFRENMPYHSLNFGIKINVLRILVN